MPERFGRYWRTNHGEKSHLKFLVKDLQVGTGKSPEKSGLFLFQFFPKLCTPPD